MPKVHVLITKHHVKMSGKVILFAKAPPIQTPFLAIISLSISRICQCRVISLISQSRLDQYHAKERCPPYRGAPLGESSRLLSLYQDSTLNSHHSRREAIFVIRNTLEGYSFGFWK